MHISQGATVFPDEHVRAVLYRQREGYDYHRPHGSLGKSKITGLGARFIADVTDLPSL